jgi:uncharacterized protein YcbK (DUF882 family)
MGYFTRKECACKCGCGLSEMSTWLITPLNKAREIAGIPFKVNSAHRCKEHNADVGGKPNSAHLTGQAIDIAFTNKRERFLILKGLIMAGFNRIGIYDTFFHVDVDKTKDQEVAW